MQRSSLASRRQTLAAHSSIILGATTALVVITAQHARGGQLSSSPSTVNFGNVAVSAGSVFGSVTISNAGSGTTVTGITLGAGCGEFTATLSVQLPLFLGNGEEFIVNVSYDPSDRNADECSISIESSGTGGGFSLLGDGLAPVLGTSPTSLAFADQLWDGGTPQTLNITIENHGDAPITASNLIVSLASGVHFRAGTPIGLPIDPSGSATIPVTFNPSSAGSFDDTVILSLNNDSPSDPDDTVALNGTGTNPVDAGEESAIDAFIPLHVAPNPCTGSAFLRFTILQQTHAEFGIYDLKGRRVRQLTASQMPAGTHRVTWDGYNQEGNPAPAGIYFARLRVGEAQQVTRIVRLYTLR